MDSNIGRNLVRIIDSIPVLDVETFDTLMTNQMNVRNSNFWPLKVTNIVFIKFLFYLNKGFTYGLVFVESCQNSAGA